MGLTFHLIKIHFYFNKLQSILYHSNMKIIVINFAPIEIVAKILLENTQRNRHSTSFFIKNLTPTKNIIHYSNKSALEKQNPEWFLYKTHLIKNIYIIKCIAYSFDIFKRRETVLKL